MGRSVSEIAQLIATQIEQANTGIAKALPYEPTSWTYASLASVMFSGFARAPVESPFVEGERVVDPLMGRTWLWFFTVRLYLPLKGDGRTTQEDMGDFTKLLVESWEADKTLGTANLQDGEPKIIDSAIASGRTAKVGIEGSRVELWMCEMDAAVEITEPM